MSTTTTDETKSMLSELNAQRNHILGILEGLSDDDLRRPVLPSAWTCVGLVQHLATEVERFWIRKVFAGEHVDTAGYAGLGWRVAPDVSPETVFALYRREIELANVIIAATPLDTPPAAWPEERWPNWRFHNLREFMRI